MSSDASKLLQKIASQSSLSEKEVIALQGAIRLVLVGQDEVYHAAWQKFPKPIEIDYEDTKALKRLLVSAIKAALYAEMTKC